MSAIFQGHKHLKTFFIVIAASFLIGSVSLTYPFGRDQGIYAYAGHNLLLGNINYKYVFDLKPPGVHFVFALAQLLMGKTMFQMRIFDIFWQALTAFSIFLLLRKLSCKIGTAILLSLLYPFLYFRYDYWHTLQADGFLNLPIVLCLYFLIKNESTHKIFLAGLMSAVVLLFKYTMAVFIPLVIIFLLTEKADKKNKIRNISLYIAGAVVMLFLTVMLYALTGSFSYFTEVNFLHIPKYAAIGFETTDFTFIKDNIIRLFTYSVYAPLFLLSVLFLIETVRKKETDRNILLAYFWLLASLINLIIQWKYFLYHFLVLIAPLVVITGLSVKYFLQKYELRKKLRSAVLVSFFTFFIVFAGRFYPERYIDVFDLASGRLTLEQMHIKNGFTTDSAFSISGTFEAVEYVKKNTYENEKIFVWGFDPLIYYLSGRESASRFIYNYPLYWKGNNEEFRKEFLEVIRKEHPALILVSRNDALYYISGYYEDSEKTLDSFPEFKKFISSNYQLEGSIENFDFYKIRKSSNNE